MSKEVNILILFFCVAIVYLIASYVEREREEVFVLVKSTKDKYGVPDWEYLGYNYNKNTLIKEAIRLQEQNDKHSSQMNKVSYIVVPIMVTALPIGLTNYKRQTEKEYWRRLKLVAKSLEPMSCLF